MQLIGERLYPLVCDLVRAEPEVVTGMLLELPKTEIEELLLSPVDLRQHVQECEQALSERVVRSPSQPAPSHPPPMAPPTSILPAWRVRVLVLS